MTQHAESLQTIGSQFQSQSKPNSSVFQESEDVDHMASRTEAIREECQKLIDETVDGKHTISEFLQALKDLGLNADEARDHVDEVSQRVELRRAKARCQNRESRESLPRHEQEDNQAGNSQARAVEAAAWESLHSKLEHALAPQTHPATIALDQLAEIFGEPKVASLHFSIPQSVLVLAPHLAEMQGQVLEDLHISKTWGLHHEYAKEKVVDSLIDLAQTHPLKDPISRAVWKLVILDCFVDFDKLYATFDKEYNHNDEPKDFVGGFSLIKKDYATAKRLVRTEADWIRTYDAWMVAVLLFYPHQHNELSKYRVRILDLCRSIQNGASIAIRFNADMQDRYAKNPFHMDDNNEHQVPFLAQLIGSPSSSAGTKHSASSQFTPRKRPSAICQN